MESGMSGMDGMSGIGMGSSFVRRKRSQTIYAESPVTITAKENVWLINFLKERFPINIASTITKETQHDYTIIVELKPFQKNNIESLLRIFTQMITSIKFNTTEELNFECKQNLTIGFLVPSDSFIEETRRASPITVNPTSEEASSVNGFLTIKAKA